MDWSSSTIHASLAKVGLDWETPLDVVVTPAEPRGAKPITESGAFTVRLPEITGGPYHGSPGATLTVTGRFFGTTKGKVYLGATSLTSCRVVSWVMNTATGESTASFVVPTKIAKGSYDLVIITAKGVAGIDEFKVD